MRLDISITEVEDDEPLGEDEEPITIRIFDSVTGADTLDDALAVIKEMLSDAG